MSDSLMTRSARGPAARWAGVAAFLAGTILAPAAWAAGPAKMDPAAKPVQLDPKAFGPDPNYEDQPYDIRRQLLIYGGKKAVDTPRPMIELGRQIYQSGPLQPSGTQTPPFDSQPNISLLSSPEES